MTPTQQAEWYLQTAVDNFNDATLTGRQQTIAIGLQQMAAGMKQMSVGLRATYKKLEDLEALIKRPGGPSVR